VALADGDRVDLDRLGRHDLTRIVVFATGRRAVIGRGLLVKNRQLGTDGDQATSEPAENVAPKVKGAESPIRCSRPYRVGRRANQDSLPVIPASRRHAIALRIQGKPTIVEFWTFAEYDALPLDQHPMGTAFIPGLGRLAFRVPENDAELRDINNESQNASDREFARLMRGRRYI
jgi:hypothetical protein